MTNESRFSWPTRIYWEDTDAGGVVYHARYVAFMERARTEWMRALGYGQEAMRCGDGQVFVVRAMNLDFLKPAKLDDALTTTVELLQCRRASLLMAQAVMRDDQVWRRRRSALPPSVPAISVRRRSMTRFTQY